MGWFGERFRALATPSAPITPWKDALSFLVLLLTIIPGGMALLAGDSRAKLAFTGITGMSLLLLMMRLAQAAYSQQIEVQRREVQDLNDKLDMLSADYRQYKLGVEAERERFAFAVERIVNYQVWLYEEELELVVTIGADSGEDRVSERHVTRPLGESGNIRLPYRSLRPIVTNDRRKPVTFKDLDLTSQVARSGALDVFPLIESRQAIRIVASFSPALRSETEWRLEYRSPGLWDTLRRLGSDELAWDTSSPGSKASDGSPFTKLTVIFVFPPGTENVSVSERDGLGEIHHQAEYNGGSAIIWNMNRPGVMKFHWEISMPTHQA